ncbi:MAG TPA: S24/S26 family peptidase [Opitutaceae bacterium]|nr:S24/S26 family peptidase [Opitutaceae bacterium]
MHTNALRLLAFAGTLGAGLGLGSCATTAPTGAPPPAQPVPAANVQKVQAWKDAEMLAARDPGRTALVGGGTSMNPVYGDNTMLVAVPIDFKDLKAGMYVVYLNRYNRRVAHRLVAKEGKGWRAQGLNNPEEDNDLVTPENLIGVIYASLTHEEEGH